MTEHFDLFLSYNRLDRRVVERLAEGKRSRRATLAIDAATLRELGHLFTTA